MALGSFLTRLRQKRLMPLHPYRQHRSQRIHRRKRSPCGSGQRVNGDWRCPTPLAGFKPNVEGVPKDFATALFNHWGIGKAEANNGLLVLLVMDQRRLEMETGYGLEPLLPDGWLGTMQSQSMVPLFKQGKFGEGLLAGVAAVAHRLNQDPAAAREGVAVPFAEAPSEGNGGFPLWPVGAVGLSGAAVGGWFWRRKRQRTCPTCTTKMAALDEQADDEHLDAGQRMEEALGSMNHEVLRCGTCGFMRTLSHWKWLTRYGRCGACGYKTQLTHRTVLVPATTRSSGSMRVEEHCRHCLKRRTYTTIIPKVSSSSSSSRSSGSRSGGGSFGGGRSGGGGAGSSW